MKVRRKGRKVIKPAGSELMDYLNNLCLPVLWMGN